MTGLIGRKLGMTRVFDAEGTHVPVTVIEAGPCPVVQVGQSQVQPGFGAKKPKRTAKALAGHVKKAGLETAPRVLQSFPVAPSTGEPPKAGETVPVAHHQGEAHARAHGGTQLHRAGAPRREGGCRAEPAVSRWLGAGPDERPPHRAQTGRAEPP